MGIGCIKKGDGMTYTKNLLEELITVYNTVNSDWLVACGFTAESVKVQIGAMVAEGKLIPCHMTGGATYSVVRRETV
jgi:hypothetical protein